MNSNPYSLEYNTKPIPLASAPLASAPPDGNVILSDTITDRSDKPPAYN